MKKIPAIIMTAVMAVMCTACAADAGKISGEWTLSTINGKSAEEYAACEGTDASLYVVNWTVSENSVAISGVNGTAGMDIAATGSGFELMQDGKVFAGVKYDEKADTLSYSVKVGDVSYDYVLVRDAGDTVSTPDVDGGDYSRSE